MRTKGKCGVWLKWSLVIWGTQILKWYNEVFCITEIYTYCLRNPETGNLDAFNYKLSGEYFGGEKNDHMRTNPRCEMTTFHHCSKQYQTETTGQRAPSLSDRNNHYLCPWKETAGFSGFVKGGILYIIMKPLESGDKLHIYSDFSPKNIIKWMNEQKRVHTHTSLNICKHIIQIRV